MKNTLRNWNVLVIGALLVCNFVCASAYAQEAEVKTAEPKSQWLDPYPKRIGLMWNAGADLVSNYIWRGLYVGGLGVQAVACQFLAVEVNLHLRLAVGTRDVDLAYAWQ